ncbi:glycosyltransferase family 8 protein [Shewanella sp. MMG014]|uniref:glycosyltransferase n=1 Tax=Shewanella sp. MMG014 TaxID=2822691 RepID=UPI001B37E363|nr:glycosyltransferase [Shewanella sp. MMG014]MBQ4890359.1 glycosyltransferase family 8 protein [Shewanella sp. MMG014]
MKKAIFTLAIGDNPMYKAALESFQAYADKVGADLIVSDKLHFHINIKDPIYSASPAWPEKLFTAELLKDYDRILYLDADILVTPHARNIFEEYTDLETVYMFDEGRHLNRDLPISQINEALGPADNWQTVDGKQSYYNFGMFLVSKECKLFQLATLEGMQKVCNTVKFYDQTYINYIIQKHNIPNQCVDAEFNRMEFLGQENYKKASFIHYAGRGYRIKCPSREIRYVDDYCELYPEKVTAQERQQMKLSAWNLFIKNLSKKSYVPQMLLHIIGKPTLGRQWL